MANVLGVDFENYHFYLHDDSSLDSYGELTRFEEGADHSHYIASKNLFERLTDLETPVFDKFDHHGDGLIYSGIGGIIDPANKFAFPILRAEATTKSVTTLEVGSDSDAGEISSQISDVSGEQLALVSGVQTRYNNRATVAGSMQMCSDALIRINAENGRFCEQIVDWVMQESGVLRATHLRHNKRGDEVCHPETTVCGPNPENYKIEDHIEFYVEMEQKTKGAWHAYHATDVQMSFTMLDPYYQVVLERMEQRGTPAYEQRATYAYKFRTPQRLGIFRFIVEYMRHGLTFVDEQSQVSVIQWRHDAFPRYLRRAYPFYLTVFLLMVGFLLFITSFLFTES